MVGCHRAQGGREESTELVATWVHISDFRPSVCTELHIIFLA